jgi:hypothetical protein
MHFSSEDGGLAQEQEQEQEEEKEQESAARLAWPVSRLRVIAKCTAPGSGCPQAVVLVSNYAPLLTPM